MLKILYSIPKQSKSTFKFVLLYLADKIPLNESKQSSSALIFFSWLS